MELPQHFLENQCFIFPSEKSFMRAMNGVDDDEICEIKRLIAAKLPPITSRNALAVMFGYNTGFVHSMGRSAKAHYRTFQIKTGTKTREIIAPKVALKGIQTWLSHQLSKHYIENSIAHGFVSGRSHLSAAEQHCGAKWVLSLDISDFFPSVSSHRVASALREIGYTSQSSLLTLISICCFRGFLTQGAPTSPVISNFVLKDLDKQLFEYSSKNDLTITRYADDIVVSGSGEFEPRIKSDIQQLIKNDGWEIATHKTSFSRLPHRIKVHGVLVKDSQIRLTKGYRNKIRAYRHMLQKGAIKKSDKNRILGHLNYAHQVEARRFR